MRLSLIAVVLLLVLPNGSQAQTYNFSRESIQFGPSWGWPGAYPGFVQPGFMPYGYSYPFVWAPEVGLWSSGLAFRGRFVPAGSFALPVYGTPFYSGAVPAFSGRVRIRGRFGF